MNRTMNATHNNFAKDPGSAICCQPTDTLLFDHPFVAAAVIDYDGRILWGNTRGKQLYFNDPDLDYDGKTVHDFLPDEMVIERLGLLRMVCDTGRSAFFRQILGGKSVVTTYHKMETIEGNNPRALILSGEASEDGQLSVPDHYFRFETKLVNFGILDKLSPREIEVLALISQGLTTDKIAEQLGRSPKTIEAHRSAISRKLGISSRIGLSEVARRAGLQTHHAGMKRVDL
ncbi:MAG: hypothetical protein ED559_13415 [Phycisphaera sp.]|nr:MAG: hypothetical protein ED559_13415 [Phycisphaera sp.]